MSILECVIIAMIAVESGGNSKAVGDNGKAVGVLQIHKEYVDDCNRIRELKGLPPKFTYEDRYLRGQSIQMAYVYLQHYGQRYTRLTGREPDAQVYARIHNGGPNGFCNRKTDKYWAKVETYILWMSRKAE